jgi:anthranilate synthase component I
MEITSRESFQDFLDNGNGISPVFATLQLDRETPVTIFQRFAGRAFFLLESAQFGESTGRYSFVGLDRTWRLSAFRGSPIVTGIDIETSGHPFDVLRRILSQNKCGPVVGLPDFFGGPVGFVTYDYVRNLEQLPGHEGDPEWPDIDFSMPGVVLIIDHLQHSTTVVVLSQAGGYDQAVQTLETIVDQLVAPSPPTDETTERLIINAPNRKSHIDVRQHAVEISNFTRDTYCEAVEIAKQHIQLGDVFQVVPSQQFQRPTHVSPMTLYRVLRSLNPSPYMYLYDSGDAQIVGASPEMLVRVASGEIHTRPIAGTRWRGKDSQEDRAIEQELLTDAKEISEHVMLVDLGRNDVGRVAAPGSVEVQRLAHIERFSHLMHIVSDVRGKLKDGADAVDAFNAVFPAGTLTGAPKIRAMEIIDKLEPTYRGPYGGAIGYFSLQGSADFAITIRTISLRNGFATVQAGGGVVANSNAEYEYNECITKASAPLLALLIAEGN